MAGNWRLVGLHEAKTYLQVSCSKGAGKWQVWYPHVKADTFLEHPEDSGSTPPGAADAWH